MKLPLKEARMFAEMVCERMKELVLKVEIAGSIRRGRPFVGDVDLVVLPKPGEPFLGKGEFIQIGQNGVGEPEKIWKLSDIICRPIDGGPNFGVMETIDGKVQIDLWVAQHRQRDLVEEIPGNFGSLLLCRTGSREHNIWLCNRAKKLGLRWHPHKGVIDGSGKLVAAESEKDIFRALKLDYIKPEDRER